jgi:hypothetical protein
VEHPLDVLQRATELGQVGQGNRVDDRGAGAGAAHLHQVRPLAVAIAGGALCIDRDRTGAVRHSAQHIRQRFGGTRDRRDSADRFEQRHRGQRIRCVDGLLGFLVAEVGRLLPHGWARGHNN